MKIEFPEAAKVLFDEAPRFICLWGGRGSGKSWSIARALLLRAAEKPMRILCCRELQNSIAESVHKLLSVQIEELGLSSFYEIQQASVAGKNGSEFIFAGIKNNATKIKSYEGIDCAWIEEAQAITKNSWEILTPTIRKPGSQIICSFNPALETDFIYQFFIASAPENARVVRMNFHDNPWFGEPLASEAEAMKERDPDAYQNVWLGFPRQVLDGAILANELRQAVEQGRICAVPYDRAKPVDTFFDLGRADKTSIWFAQQVGFEYRIVDFYENRGFALDHYLKHLSDTPYQIGTCWLPHDAEHELLASKRTIAQQMRDAGRTVRILQRVSIADRINAGRTIFPQCFFDEKRCVDGINALRRWRYDVDPDTGQFSKNPLHDDASHAGDAFTYLALALQERAKPVIKPAFKRPALGGAGGWMAS